METIARNKLHINVTAIKDTVTLYLQGHFSFDAYREFKSAYGEPLKNPSINAVTINLSEVEYLDSSALGMLLVLRDQAQLANKSLTLSRPSTYAMRTFEIASFEKIFSIL